jgi:hypothetical protein
LREELRNAPVEPLLPIEKKLIGWSLTIGSRPSRRTGAVQSLRAGSTF